jgi:hypothetical protein
LDSPGSENGPVAGSCKDGNKSSTSIKGGKLLNQISDYQLLKNNSISFMQRCGLDVSGSTPGPMTGFCLHGDELSGSIKVGTC